MHYYDEATLMLSRKILLKTTQVTQFSSALNKFHL